jgi:hypothetical protein
MAPDPPRLEYAHSPLVDAEESIMHPARVAILVGLILLAQAPRAAFAGQHTWDVGEVFSNADGTIQFVELLEADGSNNEGGVGNNSISSNAKGFSWTSGAVSNTANKRYLIASQSFANLTGAPTPNAIFTAPPTIGAVLPFFFQTSGDTVSFNVYDSCTFGAIPTNGLGARDCVTNTNTASNSPTNYAGPPGTVVAALANGLLDNFTNGTLQNWSSSASPTNQATGGPGGGGDRYLQLVASAAPLAATNEFQWAGNGVTAAFDHVDVDLNNSGPDPVSVRIMLLTPGCESGGTACTAWTSTNPTVLTSGSGWSAASFSVLEANLTRVLGSDSYAASLANVERVLIRHDDGSPDAPNVPTNVSSTLGIDNIEFQLPEPSALSGLAAGAALLYLLRRRR